MNVTAIEGWLQSFAGLEAAAIGSDAVVRAARERMADSGCGSVEAYLARLEASEEERTALLDRVVVPETWFFRDRPALDALVRHVGHDWSRRNPGRVCRVLSVPCATGEEPYSVAMAFALSGWPLERLQIDAIDISPQNVERAIRGEYGRNSFRGEDLAFRAAYLDSAGPDRWRVKERVRAPVRFATGNLLADDFAAGGPRYEAIFCRNLLIYFDRPTQARAVGTLERLLAPGGWIAVGPAEPVLLFPHGFELLKVRGGFLLHRSGGVPPSSLSAPLPPAARPVFAPVASWRDVARSAAPVAPAPEPDLESQVNEARRLADAGRLEEARRCAEAAVQQQGASAPLLFLLGLVAEGTGDALRAEEFYRKALYLEPGHAEALAHLAVRVELKGDLRAARALRERAQRTLKPEPR